MGKVVWEVFQDRGRARLDLTAARNWGGGPCGLGQHHRPNTTTGLGLANKADIGAGLLGECAPACQLVLTSAFWVVVVG